MWAVGGKSLTLFPEIDSICLILSAHHGYDTTYCILYDMSQVHANVEAPTTVAFHHRSGSLAES
jgi:hypothetical protein